MNALTTPIPLHWSPVAYRYAVMTPLHEDWACFAQIAQQIAQRLAASVQHRAYGADRYQMQIEWQGMPLLLELDALSQAAWLTAIREQDMKEALQNRLLCALNHDNA